MTNSLSKRADQLRDEACGYILKAIESWPKVGMFFSFGKDSSVILHMMKSLDIDIPVIFINTGIQYKETYEYMHNIRLESELPLMEIHARVSHEKLKTLYGDPVPIEICCGKLKHEPSRRILDLLDAFITGLRADETPEREGIQAIEIGHSPVRINPIWNWTVDDVWDYIKCWEVPMHPLYQSGYKSLGCIPCTESNRWGAAERFGRPDCKWWK